MALVRPKTFVITSMPGKVGGTASPLVPHYAEDVVVESSAVMESGPRKRKRLTHLSNEERVLRRKLKNRVAAQTARDRKKAKMTDLETAVAQLEAENRRLQMENLSLKQKTGKLAEENTELKERLGMPADVAQVKREPESESAVLTDPLQQGQALASFRQATHLTSFLLTLSLMHFLNCWKNSPKPLDLSNKKTNPSSEKIPVEGQTQPHPWVWWGPKQRSWNPSKN